MHEIGLHIRFTVILKFINFSKRKFLGILSVAELFAFDQVFQLREKYIHELVVLGGFEHRRKVFHSRIIQRSCLNVLAKLIFLRIVSVPDLDFSSHQLDGKDFLLPLVGVDVSQVVVEVNSIESELR